jgi:hypothetical protein
MFPVRAAFLLPISLPLVAGCGGVVLAGGTNGTAAGNEADASGGDSSVGSDADGTGTPDGPGAGSKPIGEPIYSQLPGCFAVEHLISSGPPGHCQFDSFTGPFSKSSSCKSFENIETMPGTCPEVNDSMPLYGCCVYESECGWVWAFCDYGSTTGEQLHVNCTPGNKDVKGAIIVGWQWTPP